MKHQGEQVRDNSRKYHAGNQPYQPHMAFSHLGVDFVNRLDLGYQSGLFAFSLQRNLNLIQCFLGCLDSRDHSGRSLLALQYFFVLGDLVNDRLDDGSKCVNS
jgi:hypothetical protein